MKAIETFDILASKRQKKPLIDRQEILSPKKRWYLQSCNHLISPNALQAHTHSHTHTRANRHTHTYTSMLTCFRKNNDYLRNFKILHLKSRAKLERSCRFTSLLFWNSLRIFRYFLCNFSIHQTELFYLISLVQVIDFSCIQMRQFSIGKFLRKR